MEQEKCVLQHIQQSIANSCNNNLLKMLLFIGTRVRATIDIVSMYLDLVCEYLMMCIVFTFVAAAVGKGCYAFWHQLKPVMASLLFGCVSVLMMLVNKVVLTTYRLVLFVQCVSPWRYPQPSVMLVQCVSP